MSDTGDKLNGYPAHIGIVLDGNRRFARKLGLDPWKGHEFGEKKVSKLVDWCREFGIRELTFYAFSLQNFNRPKKEFDYIIKLFTDAYGRLADDERISRYKIRVRFIGRLDRFPKNVQHLMRELMEKTKDNSNYTINFAMAYGGREEIIDAVKGLISDIKAGKVDDSNVNEEVFSRYLYLKSEPDLIIRTGGEKRTSNFLVWQSIYSEWIFLDKKWPEFEKEDFVSCLEEYRHRERRHGR